MGICCMAQETQTGALYQPRGVGWGGRWEGGSRVRGYMYTDGIHSSILAWKIPWMEKPGRLQSVGSQIVGHDWATLLRLASAELQSPLSERQHVMGTMSSPGTGCLCSMNSLDSSYPAPFQMFLNVSVTLNQWDWCNCSFLIPLLLWHHPGNYGNLSSWVSLNWAAMSTGCLVAV